MSAVKPQEIVESFVGERFLHWTIHDAE
jgi:hypothetical protein